MAELSDLWNDPDARDAAEAVSERISAMSDDELKALITPVRDRSPSEWSVEQLQADAELDHRLGLRGETAAGAASHPSRTVPISIRMPVDLLGRIREEAERRQTPYQRLIRDLVEAGLAASAQPIGRLEVSAELLERIANQGSVIVEVRRAPGAR